MRETPEEARRARLLWTGVILLVIGLSLVLVVGEWFAMLDACVANSTCPAGTSEGLLQGMLGLQVIGVAMAVGAVVLLVYRIPIPASP